MRRAASIKVDITKASDKGMRSLINVICNLLKATLERVINCLGAIEPAIHNLLDSWLIGL